MSELWILIGLVVLLAGLLVLNRRAENRRLRQTTREALSPQLRDEIEQEREENRGKKEKFDAAMKQAAKSG